MKKSFLKAKNSFSGFTLVELLLASLLIPLVAFAIYANFNSGVKIWQRLHQQSAFEDLDIFYQKVSRTFNTMFKYSSNQFQADKDSISFMALIDTDDKLGGDRGIGEVRIFYDAGQKAIKKEEKNMSHVYRAEPGKVDRLLGSVNSFKVSFFTIDKQDKKFKWFDEWVDRSKDELPLAVRLEFKCTDASGERLIKNTFLIPAGGSFER